MQKSYLPGDLIREIRKRKGLRQSFIQSRSFDSSDSQVTLSRIENLRQDPSKSTLRDLLSKVELPFERFFCPYMENQPAESFVLRRQITFLLDRAEGSERVQALAGELIDELKGKLDLESLVNRQLWISLKAKLDVISGAAGEETLSLINEGIRITYPEFDEAGFDSDALIFYECDLMLSLARYHAGAGDQDRALNILYRIKAGYAKQPVSEMHKEILLGEIGNLIAQFLLEKGDFDGAVKASEEAIAVSKRQTGDSQMPKSVYLRARALFHAKTDAESSMALLRQAYFAYALLKMDIMQKQIVKDAGEMFGADFETYNTESAGFELPRDFFDFETGGVLAVDNIGGLLRQFRLAAGARQSDIYKGICSRSFYSRIESGERTEISFFILEALMQRLGRDISLYTEYFSSMDEWEESRLRMRYMREISIGNRDEAQETLSALLAAGDFTRGLGKQFLLFAQAIMKWAEDDFEGYTALLYDAVRKTIPDFSEDTISDMRLTFNECNIINAIADYYTENGEIERGTAIFLRIRESMNRFYADDSIKVRFYVTLLSNLTLAHYNMKQFDRALEFAEESESICRRHGALFLINGIAHLKALCLFETGRLDEAVAYAAMAYFSGNLTMGEAELGELFSFAKDKLGVAFPREAGFVFYKEKANTYAKI